LKNSTCVSYKGVSYKLKLHVLGDIMTSFNCLLGQRIEMILMKIEDKSAVKENVENLSVDALDERGLGQFRVEMVIQAPGAG
jgi:hypothetical protein